MGFDRLRVTKATRPRTLLEHLEVVMFRIKLGVVSVLVALVVCGIGASAASAEKFELTEKPCEGGTFYTFCYEPATKTGKLLEFKGTEEGELLHEETSDIVFTSQLGGSEVVIDCGLADAEHTEGEKLVEDGLILQPKPLEASATLLFHITFLECVLLGTFGEKCKVPAELTTTEMIGEGEEKNEEFILVRPETPGVIIKLPFEELKGCPATIKGEHSVTGELLCFIEKPLEDLVEHLIVCDPEKGGQKGKLFFASSENGATFLIDDNGFLLGIKEEDPWSVHWDG